MKTKGILRGLDTETVRHPQDKSTLNKLNKIPGFKAFVDKTVSNIMEKYATIEYSAEGIDVTPQSIPAIYRQLQEACRVLDINEIPACSTDWLYHISSFSIGEKNKRIVLQSGTIDLLTPNELYFVLGHELGHMKCGHKTYHMLTECLYMPIQNTPELKLWTSLIKMPLLNWYRISDFTADRMGLLCCQDIHTALGTMIKMAGLPKKFYSQLHINSFIEQARNFNNEHSGAIDSIIKYMSINAALMPWLVVRASDLWGWCHSGEYDKILNKYKVWK